MQGDVALNRKCNMAAAKPEVFVRHFEIRHVGASGHFHFITSELAAPKNIGNVTKIMSKLKLQVLATLPPPWRFKLQF
jgi:hypothetical protein